MPILFSSTCNILGTWQSTEHESHFLPSLSHPNPHVSYEKDYKDNNNVIMMLLLLQEGKLVVYRLQTHLAIPWQSSQQPTSHYISYTQTNGHTATPSTMITTVLLGTFICFLAFLCLPHFLLSISI